MGAYSVPIAKHVQNSGGTVIAFEPQRIVFYQLCGNIIINRLDNVIALNHAVGEIDGFIEIPEIDYKYNHNIGAFSIEHDIRSRLGTQKYMKNESYNVKLISLDKFSVERSPSLIKLDVEGYELAVLKGGSSFLEEYNFPPILFESWNDEWFKNKKEELHKYILHLGYNITSIHGMDYVAQHPRNQIRVDFKNANGVVSMTRAQ
jgi:FkbM family methyltransferase